MRRNGDVHRVLERAAAEGRIETIAEALARDLGRYGHYGATPGMRCQECGRELAPVMDFATAHDGAWSVIHVEPET